MYAIVLYCLIVEFAAIERLWCRDVEKSELANCEKVLFCCQRERRGWVCERRGEERRGEKRRGENWGGE